MKMPRGPPHERLVLGSDAVESWALGQELDFHPPANVNDPTTPAVMRDLVSRILPVYQEPDTDRYLTNLSALQLVDGNYQGAWQARKSLRDRRRKADAGRPVSKAMIYDLYAQAKAIERPTTSHLRKPTR